MPLRYLFLIGLCLFCSQEAHTEELQGETITRDVVGTIGYLDADYFTLVTRPDYTPAGSEEIGFFITDELQLPSRLDWSSMTKGLAVRVTYEEYRAPRRTSSVEADHDPVVVLERKAVRIAIGQKEQKRALAS